MTERLKLLVNGTTLEVETDPTRSLLMVLRNSLGLTGSKYGCGEGQCGACTVLLDGAPVQSCGLPVNEAVGKKITTIEGLARDGQLHPVQQAFLEVEAFQCGYCTAGMVMAAAALLAVDPNPSEQAVLRAMNGHICRCGTYPRILAAIRRAAALRRGANP